jgi:glycosyltransferase involved in cell wall biosynthesis
MTKTFHPIISVLMPVYNAEKYLNEAIDSILNQTFADFEFVIINDGSTDQSEEIILSYQDARIKYFKNEVNLKLIKTLNRGLDLVAGKYVARMDADDISELNRLQVQFDFMESNPEVGIVGAGFINFKDKSTEISRVMYKPTHDEICFNQLYQIHLSHGTCMIRTEVLKINSLSFSLYYEHAEDFELFTRMSGFTKLANVQAYLYRVRHHEHEVSKLFADIQTQNSYRLIKREFEKIGYLIADNEIEDFILLNQYEYAKINADCAQLQSFLEKLIFENSKTKNLNVNYFNDRLKFLWFNYCYNTKKLRDYQASKILTQGFNIPLLKRLKWMMK